jgi:hypothetical protein
VNDSGIFIKMKNRRFFGFEMLPEAQEAYNHANATVSTRLGIKRRKAAAVASAATSRPSTVPVQPVVEWTKVKPSPEAEAFARLSVREQARELKRLIGLSRLGLNDDLVAETMRKAIQPYERR